jgi:menaquinone-dependent protoporphyrinogen oxidase
MKVLVTVASKHGTTGEIGEIIAGVLRDAGHEVESHPPDDVIAVDGYDAVVLGSAVYVGRFLDPARSFVERHEKELAGLPVWLFSSGPIGDPPLPAEVPTEAAMLAERIGARAYRSFSGRLLRRQLGFVERTVTKALKAPEGDFRDLDAIRAWADEITAALSPKEVPI